MTRLVYRPRHPRANKNGMVPAEIAGPKHGGGDLRLYVIGDEMAPTRHMANGQVYTSKKKFRDATRAAGCVEVGNDPAITRPRKRVELDRGARREAIRQVLHDDLRGR